MTTLRKRHSNDSVDKSKSEEVQDIIERMPTRWAAWTALMVALLMCMVVILSIIIKYPDTISGQVVITSSGAPIRLVANSRGSLHLLKENDSMVKSGERLAYIASGGSLKDILTLEKICSSRFTPQTTLRLRDGLSLGELSASYNALVTTYQQYDLLRHSSLYANMRQSLCQQIEVDSIVAGNMKQNIALKSDMENTRQLRHYKDSLLYVHKAISEEEYENRLSTLNELKASVISLHSTLSAKHADISKSKVQLSHIDIEEREALQKAYADVATQYDRLRNDVAMWYERHLLVAPIDGIIEYLGFWRDNRFVQQDEELFTIIPRHNDCVVEAYIPAYGTGKVRVGQDVNIKLDEYPYSEYGLIKGTVAALSQVTNKIDNNNRNVDTYRVKIRLTNGIVTNHGIKLPLKHEMKGTADIITQPKRLIERLFDNLRSKQIK